MKLYLSLAIVATTISYMVYVKHKQISNSHTIDFKQTGVHENKTIVSSSSSSRQPQNWEYDVFVSFHGKDVREGFLSHFLKGLRSKAIDPFVDDEMERGVSIKSQLKRAIKGSKIQIVLLSENYASSSWCLDELSKIIKYRKMWDQKVITIFYKVEPTDVNHQVGYFGKVFKKTCKGRPRQVIQKWKEALVEVATIAGYVSRNWVNEAIAVDEISIGISNMLNHFDPSHYLDCLDGMEVYMENLQLRLRLDLTDELRTIEIWHLATEIVYRREGRV